MTEQDTRIPGVHRARDLMRMVMGIGGLIALVVGVLILFNPVESGAAAMQIVAVVLAIYLVIAGIVYLGAMIFSREMSAGRRVGTAVLGLLYLIAGIIVFGSLSTIATVLAAFLAIFIGVMWVFEGIMSFTSLKHQRSKALTVIYGIISVIAGLVLIISPLFAAVALWMILGASLAVMGVVQIVRALQMKSGR
jgi:uncharacterized membrane protein HdeD (DUF308 family)